MSHIFLSYSRRDLIFAQKIVGALSLKNLDIWIDQEDIPKGEDWWRRIQKGIEDADAFLFLISPDSIKSAVCNNEINHAIENSKRILPILIRDVNPQDTHSEISRRNWVYCRDSQDDFDKAISVIIEAIQTDYKWLTFHTELQVKALKWEDQKDNSRLLRGKELREAEERFAQVNKKSEPQPTELQRIFIISSKEREKKVKQRVIGSVITVALAILGLLAWPYLARERAIPGNWVKIPEGKFTMGMDQKEAETAYSLCTEEALETEKDKCTPLETLLTWSGIIENVELPEFRILENEVTNAQYRQCSDFGACSAPAEWKYEEGGANQPATGLNWFQAGEYCTWLGGRLPTEIEWEKAASGPDGTNNYFPWGNIWGPDRANLKQFGIGSIQSITQYADSDISYYGVKNMAGNAREWTASEAGQLDATLASTNLVLELDNKDEYYPVTVRGGAWINEPSTGMSSARSTDGSIISRPTLGFRCVCPTGKTCASPWSWSWIWFGKY